jgi:hypothetical protein
MTSVLSSPTTTEIDWSQIEGRQWVADCHDIDEPPPLVTDEKDLYRRIQESVSNENIQENLPRIVRGTIDEASNRTPVRHSYLAHRDFVDERIRLTHETLQRRVESDIKRLVQTIAADDIAFQAAALETYLKISDRLVTAQSLSVFKDAIAEALASLTKRVDKVDLVIDEESFTDRASRLDKLGRTDSALDLLYDSVDDLMRRGCFDELNSIISDQNQNVEEHSVDILLGLLTSTLPARNRLPARVQFLSSVEEALKSRGEYEEGLLNGL